MGALLGGIGALAGGLAGLLNPRPPSLSPVQSGALNQLIPSLMAKTQGPAQIDPTQQAALFGQINQNTVGANNAAIHSLTGAGLGRSGLLGSALIQNQDQAASSKNQADLGLQQQAVQVQQQDLQSSHYRRSTSGISQVRAGQGPSPTGLLRYSRTISRIKRIASTPLRVPRRMLRLLPTWDQATFHLRQEAFRLVTCRTIRCNNGRKHRIRGPL